MPGCVPKENPRIKILQGMLDGPRKAPAADLIALAFTQGYELGRRDRQWEIENAFAAIFPNLSEQGH